MNELLNLPREDLIHALELLPADEREEFFRLLEQRRAAEAQDDFMTFMHYCRPDFVEGRHHRIVADALESVERGEIKRLMVFMPPRSTKSMMISEYFPAWYLGRNPTKQVLSVSYSKDMAADFGKKVRNIVGSEEFHDVFPRVGLRADSRGSFRWHTNHDGVYNAAGITSGIAGKGAHLGLIDDPLNEQDAYSEAARLHAMKWYPGGFSSRLMNDAPVILLMTRWHQEDLAGYLLREADERGFQDQWTVIKIPALLDEDGSKLLGYPVNTTYWPPPEDVPEDCGLPGWTTEQLLDKKEGANPLPPAEWACLYQQNPQIEGGNIIKSEWWQTWELPKPPHCDMIILSCDTAFKEKDKSDYSAIITWGVFRHNGIANMIMIAASHGRWAYPDLRRKVIDSYQKKQVDLILVEDKASGQSLIQELERVGLPVLPYEPDRDKIARAHACTPIFASKRIWAPPRDFAQEVIQECSAFPSGRFKDYVDATTQAVLYVRDNYMVGTEDDEYANDFYDGDYEPYKGRGYG